MGYSYGSVALTLRGTVEVRMITATVLTLTAGDAEVFVHLTNEIKEQIRDLVEEWDRKPAEPLWGDGIVIP